MKSHWQLQSELKSEIYKYKCNAIKVKTRKMLYKCESKKKYQEIIKMPLANIFVNE